MHQIRRILVAVKDTAAKSQPAVVKAVQLARACDAKLELFHALDTTLYVDAYLDQSLTNVERNLRARSLQRLEAMAHQMRRQGVRVTATAEWDFPAYEAVVRRAQRSKADLIVADNHRRHHRLPRLLHLADWELLRLSPTPVLLVKTARPYRHPAVLAAVDPSHAFAKPAKLDDEILRVGTTVTHALRGTLHAVHAYTSFPPTSLRNAVHDRAANVDVAQRSAARATALAQADFKRVLRKAKISRTRQYLTTRFPTDAIEHVARKTHSAIVVMGALSRSGLKSLFIGNTAESLLDRLNCDILVVKPATFVNRVPRGRRGPRLAVLG